MLRTTLVAALALLLLAGCIAPLGDRVLQVKADVVSDTGAPLRGCMLGLYSTSSDQAIEVKSDIRTEFLTTFLNPPTRGSYYFKITCPGQSGSFRSSNHDFASPPYFHDLGRVVIKS